MSQVTETRYEAICEASPDAILLIDTAGRITYANGRVTEMSATSQQNWLVNRPGYWCQNRNQNQTDSV